MVIGSFFYPYVIQTQKDHGKTQQEIGDSIGWSRTKIADYCSIQNSVVADVLEIAKSHQEGRATSKVAIATFNFTEGWFRNSGLYNLSEKYQEEAPCKDQTGGRGINPDRDMRR